VEKKGAIPSGILWRSEGGIQAVNGSGDPICGTYGWRGATDQRADRQNVQSHTAATPQTSEGEHNSRQTGFT